MLCCLGRLGVQAAPDQHLVQELGLSKEQVALYVMAFEAVDVTNDGGMDEDDFEWALHCCYINTDGRRDELNAIIKDAINQGTRAALDKRRAEARENDENLEFDVMDFIRVCEHPKILQFGTSLDEDTGADDTLPTALTGQRRHKKVVL